MELSSILRARGFDERVVAIMQTARIPGAAIAIVVRGETILAQGYGHASRQPLRSCNSQTLYPIASTTKAINATVLGMLVDEGTLDWDVPVRDYLPEFYLGDAGTADQVTLRDLLIMRTGLPRHDWMWIGNSLSRAELVKRLRHLELSRGFRERFQYNNLTVTAAGHVAERVTGRTWSELVQERLLEPLRMSRTVFSYPANDENVTSSYHETTARQLLATERIAGEVTAPSGGAIYSTVEDMARWIKFNLARQPGNTDSLIRAQTLAEIHSPQIVCTMEQGAPSASSTYAIGWFVDLYNGHRRLSHAGYLNDVHSEVMLFPEQQVGVVCFTNFGAPGVARLICQDAFDTLLGLTPVQSLGELLSAYESKIVAVQARAAATQRLIDSTPSHDLNEYTGEYQHPAYGSILIARQGEALILHRPGFSVALEHWHHDAWIAKDSGRFVIHVAHVFNSANRLLFETNADGVVASVSIPFEPAVAPIRFRKSTT